MNLNYQCYSCGGNCGGGFRGRPCQYVSGAIEITARPDEVVAYMMTCKPYGRPPEFYVTKPDFVPPISTLVPLVPKSALQSANARLAELEAERDAALAKAAEWNRIAESTREWGRQHLKNYDALTDAVLALADELDRDAAEDKANGVESMSALVAAMIRRAAAGEGDANQGDGE